MKKKIPYGQVAFLLILTVTVFRLWYATTLELAGDEAYYWVWSKYPDWCYFSKGPGVAWMIGLGTAVFGDTVFGVRFFAVLLSAGTASTVFLLGKRLFGSETAFWSVVVSLVFPLYAVGSVLMTIDPLSVFFWSVGAMAFWRAKEGKGYGWWIGTGFCIGLGMLCKYTNVALLISLVLFCLWTPGQQKWLVSGKFWVMAATTLLCLAPVAIWNVCHDWITLEHLVHRGGLDEKWSFRPGELLEFLKMQGVVYSPLLWLGVMGSVAAAFGRKDRDLRYRYLAALFVPLFGFYAILSSHEAGEANWTAPCYVTGAVLAAAYGVRLAKERRVWRMAALGAVVLALAETSLLHGTFWLNLPNKMDPLNRVRGWESLAEQTQALAKERNTDFLICYKYTHASLLRFYLPGHPTVYLPRKKEIENQYSLWESYGKRQGESALFVNDHDYVPESLRKEFAEIVFLKKTPLFYHGREIRPVYFYLCKESRG